MISPRTKHAGIAAFLLVVLLSGCQRAEPVAPEWETAARPAAEAARHTGSDHLFVWAGDADRESSDFLAVVDARRSEPTYGEVVATLPVGATGTMPHHTEYEFPANNMLFANGWEAGHTFVIDLRNPREPKLAADFIGAEGYSFPHSFARLPNDHVLATFQGRDGEYGSPGGLVELDALGKAIRSVSAATPGLDDSLIWPYSLIVLPEIDRAVSTSSEMGMPPWEEYADTYHVQIWSIEDLSLLATVPLPQVEQAPYHLYPAEPRVLGDGTVYLNTFNCGLYRIVGLEGTSPTAEFLRAFPWTSEDTACGGPVVYGNYWIQTVAALPGLVVIDVSDPANPVEASRLVLDDFYAMPHWLAADRSSPRIVLTGGESHWVLIVDIDEATGALSIDESFRSEGSEQPGVSFDRTRWPHGDTGTAIVHGALFGQ